MIFKKVDYIVLNTSENRRSIVNEAVKELFKEIKIEADGILINAYLSTGQTFSNKRVLLFPNFGEKLYCTNIDEIKQNPRYIDFREEKEVLYLHDDFDNLSYEVHQELSPLVKKIISEPNLKEPF